MTTVSIGDETNDKVEELQDKLPWGPTKKDIIGTAIKEYHTRKIDEQTDN